MNRACEKAVVKKGPVLDGDISEESAFRALVETMQQMTTGEQRRTIQYLATTRRSGNNTKQEGTEMKGMRGQIDLVCYNKSCRYYAEKGQCSIIAGGDRVISITAAGRCESFAASSGLENPEE